MILSNNSVRFLFVCFALMVTTDLFAYTTYSDMAGSATRHVWGYSYTDLSGQDWHYTAQAIYQTLRNPEGIPVSGWGGPTSASISQYAGPAGNYNLLARHEMWCTLHGAFVTPYTSVTLPVWFSQGNYFHIFYDPVFNYEVCLGQSVRCDQLFVFEDQLPQGVTTYPPYLRIVTMDLPVPPLWICIPIGTLVIESCSQVH